MRPSVARRWKPPLAALAAILCLGSASAARSQLAGVVGKLAAAMSPSVAAADKPATAPLPSGQALPTQNKEIGELATPRALLRDSPALQRLLGEDPPFVYDPAGRPDPMLIPWTRAHVMFGELSAIAEQAIAAKNWQMADTAYRRMLALDSQESRAKAQAGLDRLEQLVAQEQEARLPGSTKPREAKLPAWVAANTRSVIVDKNQPMCLVGSFVLKVGDTVPRQPIEVTVAKIEPSAVHYKVQDKIFVVKIQEGE